MPDAARPWRRAFLALLLAIGAFLVFRSSRPHVWSEWAFGDAQTLMTLRYWKEDGVLFHKGFFHPHGFARATRLFDEPEFRHLAHGINPGSTPGVPQRLYYTHYPPGYLWIYYPFYWAGLEDPRALAMISLALSLAAAGCWFLVFETLASPPVALAAGAYYLGSLGFQAFAGSLANQPVDDLLRAAIVLAVLRGSGRTAWALILALCTCSLDSHFFVGLWIVGWDLWTRRRPCWGRWAAFATAPLIVLGLQLLQNAWYLGWDGVLDDIRATLARQTVLGGIRPHAAFLFAWRESFLVQIAGLRPGLLLLVFAAVIVGTLPERRALLLLVLAGAAYFVVFPRAGKMAYQGRQLLPFVALLAGSALVHGLRALARRERLVAALGQVFLGVALFGASVAHAADRAWIMVRMGRELETPRFARHLAARWEGERVYFNLGAIPDVVTVHFVSGFAQVNAVVEHESGGPILSYADLDRLAADLAGLWRRSPAPFRAVLLLRRPGDLAAVWVALRRVMPELAPDPPGVPEAFPVRGGAFYVMDLTPGLPRRP